MQSSTGDHNSGNAEEINETHISYNPCELIWGFDCCFKGFYFVPIYNHGKKLYIYHIKDHFFLFTSFSEFTNYRYVFR